MPLLTLNHLEKTYQSRLGHTSVAAVRGVNLNVEAGEYVAIMGESGSGKSTLLNLVATLTTPTSGQVLLNGQDLSHLNENQQARFRREHLGFVFQDFDLLDTFNVYDNIVLPLVLARVPVAEMQKRVAALAPKLGLADLLQQYPYELSGGQQQRVAAARAVITEPDLLLADEPTGALDSKTADTMLQLFAQLNATGQTILMVTHSAVAASHSKRVLFIKDGQLFHQLYRGDQSQGQFLAQITTSMTALLTTEDAHA